jgi:hypothetical protein
MGDLFNSERLQIVGARLAGASVTKTTTLLGCIESDSLGGYVGIHESWEDNISEKEKWTKINIGRKRSS